jgi:Ca-activated chloride channel family protein
VDLSRFSAFHFLHPVWLIAILPLAGLAFWFALRQRRTGGWSQVVDPDLLPALRLQSEERSGTPWPLIGGAWICAALALAGPTWRQAPSPAYSAPGNWVVVLDLSPSMAVGDVAPDRATRARYAINDILGAAQDARVGLIVFAGEAHTVVPLTSDVATVRALLQPLTPRIMPEAGDDVEPALDDAATLLQRAGSRNGTVIVLSDGFADPAGAMRAAQALRQQGATLQVVGVGTAEGAPLLDANGAFVHDAQGASVLSKLPVDELRHLAGAGGGSYWSLSEVGAMLASLKNDASNPLEQDAVATKLQVGAWRNEGIWLLPLLLVFVALCARRGWL